MSSILANLKGNTILKNAVFLGIIQIFNYVFPLITIPYLVKIFGLSIFGMISMAQLVASYIYIVTDYGFNLSGTRKVVLEKFNVEALNTIFSSIVVTKLLLSLLCLVIAIIIFILVPTFNADFSFYFIMSLSVIGQVFFPTWFFQGMEDMKIISIINGISRAITTALIILLIKSQHDLLEYAILFTLSNIIVGFGAFFYCKRKYHLKMVIVTGKQIIDFLKSGFNVFLPTFFSNVLTTGGILILGLYHSEKLVGIFNSIDKFVKAFVSFVGSITQALFPNLSSKFLTDRAQAMKLLFGYGKKIMLFLFICFILSLLIGKFFLEFIYDKSYSDYAYILYILMGWVLLSFANNFIGIQFLVGSGNSLIYRKSFLISVFFTISLFYLIIPYKINGLLCAVLLGEVSLMITMLYFIKRKLVLNEWIY